MIGSKRTLGFVLVLLGNVLRLGAGMVVFVVLARWLGPSDFGLFSFCLAMATLAVIPVNFGFSTAVLRAFGADPDRKSELMSAVLTAKLLLATAVLLGALALLVVHPLQSTWIFVPLLLAQIFESIAELYVLSFRASADYGAEARTASLVSVVHIVVVLIAPAITNSVLFVAWAFLLSRIIGLGITRWQAQRSFAQIPLASIREAIAFSRGAIAYAVELGLNTVYTQFDVLIINAVLGLRAVGLYQAGMKLVQGFSRLAPILALYILPKLTGSLLAKNDMRAQTMRTLLLFGGVGLSSGAVLAISAEPLTLLLFGPQFAELAALLPLFGCLLALRFLETGCGLVLVAAGLQSSKVWLVAAQLLLLLSVGWVAIHLGGLSAWLLTTVGCTLLLIAMYALLWRYVRAPAIR